MFRSVFLVAPPFGAPWGEHSPPMDCSPGRSPGKCPVPPRTFSYYLRCCWGRQSLRIASGSLELFKVAQHSVHTISDLTFFSQQQFVSYVLWSAVCAVADETCERNSAGVIVADQRPRLLVQLSSCLHALLVVHFGLLRCCFGFSFAVLYCCVGCPFCSVVLSVSVFHSLCYFVGMYVCAMYVSTRAWADVF